MRLLTFLFGLLLTTPLLAQPYTLVPGDTLSLQHNLTATPKSATIDIDGNIRLPELGTLHAMGLTLDQLETHLSDTLTQTGFRGTPSVSVEITRYAPIVVSGVVQQGGQLEYFPGLTVAVALSLAGGAPNLESDPQNNTLALLNARRNGVRIGEEIAETVALLARLDAALAGPDAEIELTDLLKSYVPQQQMELMTARLSYEAEVLRNQRNTATMLQASWEREITENTLQLELLDKRRNVKTETVSYFEAELAKDDKLRGQGLATNARTSALVQRLADEREDLLALETTKVTVRRAIALAERNMQRFYADQRQQNLESRRTAWARMEQLTSSYGFSLNEMSLRFGAGSMTEMDNAVMAQHYQIISPRADRFENQSITAQTPLLPGDLLIVSFGDSASSE